MSVIMVSLHKLFLRFTLRVATKDRWILSADIPYSYTFWKGLRTLFWGFLHEERKEMTLEKRIEVVEMRVGDLKHDFGNPRKIKKAKLDELEKSFETFGDFGLFIINENDSLIAGNQRATVLAKHDPDTIVTCKRLIGYSEAELRAINIKDNTHAGEWDLDLLSDWTADLTVDLGLEGVEKNLEDRKIKDMELIHYEKYDYVLLVCKNQLDYDELIQRLGIDGAKVKVSKRTIKGRAVWYDKVREKLFGE